MLLMFVQRSAMMATSRVVQEHLSRAYLENGFVTETMTVEMAAMRRPQCVVSSHISQ